MSQSPYFSVAFIQNLMRQHFPTQTIDVSKVALLEVDNSASILATLASAHTEKLIGHFGLEVTFCKDGIEQKRRMVMKIKPHGDEIVAMLNMLAQACGGELATVYVKYKHLTGFQFTHLREQEIYSKLNPSFTPEIFGLYTNQVEDIYIVLMEYLDEVELLNTVMKPEQWTDKHIKTSLNKMAEWHSEMLATSRDLNMDIWPDTPGKEYMIKMVPVWQALLNNTIEKFPDLYDEARVNELQSAINSIPARWDILEYAEKTLIHNDTNPRNSCFKWIDGKLQFCLYDWELSTFHIPQYDVAEFLCFVLDKNRYHLRAGYIEYYRSELETLTGNYRDKQRFNHEFYLVTLDFGIHRLGMYMMAHSISPYPFLPRVINSFFDTIMTMKPEKAEAVA